MTHPAQATYDAKTLVLQDAFLLAFAKLGNISEAAVVSGVTPKTAYQWLREDTLGIRERAELAHREYGDWLEQVTRKRLEEPQYNGRIGSDVLLIASHNAHNPERWRRDTVVVGSDATKQLIDKLTQLAARQQPQVIDVDTSPQATIARMLAPGGEKAAFQE